MQPIRRAVTDVFCIGGLALALHFPLARQLACSNITMGVDCCGEKNGVQALTVEDKNGTVPNSTNISHADFLAKRLPFYSKRIELFDKFLARETKKVETAKEANEKLKIVLPDGNEKEGIKGATTPMDIAKSISSGLAKKVLVAQVDGKEWDINRPLIGDCALKLFGSDSPEGMDVRPLSGTSPSLCINCLPERSETFCVVPYSSTQ
jgi:hypothetical protein